MPADDLMDPVVAIARRNRARGTVLVEQMRVEAPADEPVAVRLDVVGSRPDR